MSRTSIRAEDLREFLIVRRFSNGQRLFDSLSKLGELIEQHPKAEYRGRIGVPANLLTQYILGRRALPDALFGDVMLIAKQRCQHWPEGEEVLTQLEQMLDRGRREKQEAKPRSVLTADIERSREIAWLTTSAPDVSCSRDRDPVSASIQGILGLISDSSSQHKLKHKVTLVTPTEEQAEMWFLDWLNKAAIALRSIEGNAETKGVWLRSHIKMLAVGGHLRFCWMAEAAILGSTLLLDVYEPAQAKVYHYYVRNSGDIAEPAFVRVPQSYRTTWTHHMRQWEHSLIEQQLDLVEVAEKAYGTLQRLFI